MTRVVRTTAGTPLITGKSDGYPTGMSSADTTKTVLVAGAANLVLAFAKILAGALAGSSAMLAEGAHSIGDTPQGDA